MGKSLQGQEFKLKRTVFTRGLLLGLALLLAGCSRLFGPPPENGDPTQAASSTPTLAPVPALTITPPAARPTPLQVEQGPALKPGAALPGVGKWSPTGEAFLLGQGEPGLAVVLSSAAAPDFVPIPLSGPVYPFSFEWSPRGELVVFSAVRHPQDAPQIWAVDPDGSNLRSLAVFSQALSTDLAGWLDPQHLVYASDLGGGHLETRAIEISSGQKLPWGAVLFGRVYTPQNGTIPGLAGSALFEVIMISERFPEQRTFTHLNTLGSYRAMPEGGPVSPPLSADQRFLGWRGQSSQALVLWMTLLLNENQAWDHHLLLWDVDADQTHLVAPNARGGLISPEGDWLAYLTRGPASLDFRPRLPDQPPPAPLSETDFLQVLDLQSEVLRYAFAGVLHRPVMQDKPDPTGTYRRMEAAFSPGSRYLAFLSRGPAEFLVPGDPDVPEIAGEAGIYLNILDLREGRLVFAWLAHPVSGLAWSPAGSRLAFQDPQAEWVVFDLETSYIRTLTLPENGRFNEAAWSSTGRYLSLAGESCAAGEADPCLSLIFEVGETD
jgi:hypothetical protein